MQKDIYAEDIYESFTQSYARTCMEIVEVMVNKLHWVEKVELWGEFPRDSIKPAFPAILWKTNTRI